MKTFLEWMGNYNRKKPDLNTAEGREEWLQVIRERMMKGVPAGKVADAISKYMKKAESTLELLGVGIRHSQWVIVAETLSEELDQAAKQIENLVAGSDQDDIAQYYNGWDKQELQLLAGKVAGLSAFILYDWPNTF
jgi:hypothetical protein